MSGARADMPSGTDTFRNAQHVRMPRACKSLRISVVCALQSRGRLDGLTGLPILACGGHGELERRRSTCKFRGVKP